MSNRHKLRSPRLPHLFDCKIAYVALIDANRQWFKASCGLDASETARDVSFCTRTIANDDLLVIPDTHADERFAHNPFGRWTASRPLLRWCAAAG
jgi:hypothetical protein